MWFICDKVSVKHYVILTVNLSVELILKKVQRKHLALIAELAKTLNIEIEAGSGESDLHPEFLEKIKRSREDFEAGRYKSIKTAELWK